MSARALPEKTAKFGVIPKPPSALMRLVRVPTVVFSDEAVFAQQGKYISALGLGH